MARKKVREDSALKYDIKTRVNQQHYDRLNRLLSGSHYRKMSELLRDIICNKPVTIYTRDESLGVVMAELTRLRKELNAIGVNINQVVRQINATGENSRKLLSMLELTELYGQVNPKVRELLTIISEISKRWLQK